MKNKFYITTAIDYVNGRPHIGHGLEKTQADVLARYHRLLGDEVFFLTGTDENAQKNVLAAQKNKTEAQKLVDANAAFFKKMNQVLEISNNDFIRTSDKKKHWPGVKKLWEACFKTGDIYKKKYQGLYCVGCEAFVTKKDLDANGYCPEHLVSPEKVEEENYFFKLSRYQKELEKAVSSDRLKIVPETRKNEILSFLEQGLEDFSISRPSERMNHWGIPVPGDKSQTIYVWMDALANYITALGYGREEKLLDKFWPADLHVIGKGIIRFHALYWPAMLLSAGLALPKRVFVHDYITVEGQKMSKTLGNVINPIALAEKYSSQAVRYFFLREISPFSDGDFSYEKFEERYNADLANGLGNLLRRVVALSQKTFGSKKIKANYSKNSFEPELKRALNRAPLKVGQKIEEYRFNEALSEIWSLISACDAYIDHKRPWESDKGKKEDCLKNLLFAIRRIACLLEPFLPQTSQEILSRLGSKAEEVYAHAFEIGKENFLLEFSIKEKKPLFPRLN